MQATKMTHPSLIYRILAVFCVVMLTLVIGTPVVVVEAQDGSQQQTHVVQAGENLFRIALRYGLTVDVLAAANGISNPTQIYAGQVLIIPSGTAASTVPAAAPINNDTSSAPVAAEAVYHVVQGGETLAAIGRLYNVNWTDLVAWNGLANANHIYVGQRLLVNNAGTAASVVNTDPAVPAAPAPAATGGRSYTVQRGDNLAAIGRQYGISWPTIARVNNITNPNTIYVGMVLTIPETSDTPGSYMPNAPAAPAPTITSGKQIIVDLSDQTTYAYENGQLLRSVVISSGLPGTPTVVGDFKVYWKLTSQTMSGPGYYLPGVPWVMYFYRDYALHGTYWHNNFGQPMSHGCVNMPTDQAEWFFLWAEVGTPVKVQY